MRTSRISRDTSRILAASRAQRTLRQTRTGANVANRDAHNESSKAGEGAEDNENEISGSELGSVPTDSGSDGGIGRTNKKRKRGQNTSVVMKHEREEIEIPTIASPNKGSKPKKARRMPAKKVKASDGSVKVEPPSNWEEIYALTRQMRNENIAPVDTMGCESLADRTRTPRDQRFQTLVALMLSSQTKDTVTAVAMRGMQEKMPGGFNLESVLALEPPALNAFINKVGFHNLKTKYIKQTAEILRDKWNSDIPDTIEGLTSLPGVGPKMAYLTLSAAWGRDEGIGVDVHVHRITNLWGWHKTQQPEQTRAALESWLPKDKWHDINNLLVGFGQTICLPVGRKCGNCKLAYGGLCPSAVVAKNTKIKREEAVVKVEAPTGESIVQEKAMTAEVGEIKAEDMEGSTLDIEDIGKEPRKRTSRKKSIVTPFGHAASHHLRFDQVANSATEACRRGLACVLPVCRHGKSLARTFRLRIKAERARLPILLMIASLAYLATTIWAINTSLVSVWNVHQARFISAHSEFMAQSGSRDRERMLYKQLDILLESQLNKVFVETHDECLARGLSTADDQFFGHGFQYPDIRNQTMDWTMENCGRLLYTPQVLDSSPQQAILKYWARTSYRGRQMAEEALSFVKQKAHWIYNRLFSTDPAQNGSTHIDTAPAFDQNRTASNDRRLRIKMPFDFDLHCEESHPCRLVYPPTSAKLPDKATISAEAVAKSKRKLFELCIFQRKLTSFRQAIDVLGFVLVLSQGVLGITYGAIELDYMSLAAATRKRVWSTIDTIVVHYKKEEMYVMESLGLEFASQLACLWTMRNSSTGHESTLLWGIFMGSLGLSMLIQFFCSSQLENGFRILDLAKELYLIVQDPDIPDMIGEKQGNEDHGARSEVEGPSQLNQESSSPAVRPDPAVQQHERTARRSFSPSTTIQEDIQTELKAMREEKYGNTSFEPDIKQTETETDTDNEDESFDDLADSVTPTSTEVDSDWSVVDA